MPQENNEDLERPMPPPMGNDEKHGGKNSIPDDQVEQAHMKDETDAEDPDIINNLKRDEEFAQQLQREEYNN